MVLKYQLQGVCGVWCVAFSSSLPNLRTLSLSNCQLSGPIDFSFSLLRLLSVLHLDDENLSTTIPGFFANFSKLTSLSLSSCSLRGVFPEKIFNRPTLQSLNLSNNMLLNGNQSNIFILDLSDNQITGEILNWIWEVGNGSLTHLNISYNLLQHLKKPYKIPSLNILDIHANLIEGDLLIPPPFAVNIDYSSNNFSSSIPADIGDSVWCSSIFFSLSNNSLTGAIPESICNSSFLEVLDLSNNSMSGKIPDCLLSIYTTFGALNLGRNSLAGAIPDKFSPDCVRRTLDLSRNDLCTITRNFLLIVICKHLGLRIARPLEE